MRRLALLPIVALVACNNAEPGLLLDVFVEPGTTVELYAAKYCDGCPRGVKPPALTAMPISEAYLSFDGQAQPQTADASGLVRFRVATSYDTYLGIILVVATKPDGTQWTFVNYNVEIKEGASTRWEIRDFVQTYGLIDTVGTVPVDGTRRMLIWNRPGATTQACVLFEEWYSESSNGQTTINVDRDLVVPEDNMDCDALMTADECDPWTFNAILGPPKIETADCLLPISSIDGICRIGGPQCSETGGTVNECASLPEDYCLPQGLCGCAGMADLSGCLMAKFDLLQTDMPHALCEIHVDTDGTMCGGKIVLQPDIYLSGGSGTKCTAIRIADMATPFGPFVTEAPYPNGKMKLDNFSTPCRADLYFEGPLPANVPRYSLFELELDNRRHLVIPTLVGVKQGCDVQSRCDFFPGLVTDTMMRCVAEPAEGCYATQQCPDGGAYCHGTCCPPGEECTLNGCMCGDVATCPTGSSCIQDIYTRDECGVRCCPNGQCANPWN